MPEERGGVYDFRSRPSMRRSASWMFSMLFAYEKRRWPSPNSPKAVPDRQATPASSSRRSASALLPKPVRVMFGKT